MSVRFILGESGQGKTEYIKNEVISRSMQEPEQSFFVIVPEQFSLQMQREMVLSYPSHGFFHVDILSFFRLAYRVFDECCYEPGELLEDLGVSMILKKILHEHAGELPYFKKSIHQQGFLDKLKSMIMEFISYGVDCEKIENLEDKIERYPALNHKIKELSVIYRYFMEEISGTYMVMEQTLDVLKDLVPKSKLLSKGIFYFDGFTGFTPLQLKVLSALILQAKEVVFTVTIPYFPVGRREREELFYFSEKSVKSILKICEKQKVGLEDPVILNEKIPPRYEKNDQGRELSFFQKNIFRPRSKVWAEEVSAISIVRCVNPEEEAEYILHKAEELVRKQGYRYRDIAILTGNEEEYIPAFLRQAKRLHLPLFADVSRQLSYQAGVEAVRALFYLAQMDYSYESVFRYLKSGMSNLLDEETDYLENYILAAGIRGFSMWNQPMKRRTYLLGEEGEEKIERLRQQVMSETRDCYLVLKDGESSVREKMTALYQTLVSLDFEKKFKEKAWKAKEQADFDQAREYEQFYPLLMDLMDKTVNIFGDMAMPVKELAQIMDAGLESLGITVAPLSMDQLIVGDLKRTRLPQIKALFLAGMNDTFIPPIPGEHGLLSDDEKEILAPLGVELSLRLEEQVLENEFYMYLAFAKPRESLFFSYSSMGNDGSARRPSLLLGQCVKIFPKLKIRDYLKEEKRKYYSWEDSRELLRECIREAKKQPDQPAGRVAYALFSYGMDIPCCRREIGDLWEKKSEFITFDPLSGSLPSKLYGDNFYGSVTRLERYNNCPYQFFLTYGLGLNEREEYKVKALDLGNVFHSALEYYSRKIRYSEYSWKTVPKEFSCQWKKEALSYAVDERLMEMIGSSQRNRHYLRTMERIFNKTIEVLHKQLKNSDFEPDKFECRFGKNDFLESTVLSLEEKRTMRIEGIIDRLDIYEDDDCIYVKIIDYKSGNTRFDIDKVYHGMQMQLMVYMNAALEIYGKETGKKVVPAGMYYYQVKDPLIRIEKPDEKMIMKEFCLSGYTNSDPEVLKHLEVTEGEFVSVPVRMTKGGAPYSNAPVMESEDFLAMGEHIRHKITEIGKEIYCGNITPYPYKNASFTVCDYCPYHGVCGFDDKLPGYRYKEFEKLSANEVIKQIREQVD